MSSKDASTKGKRTPVWLQVLIGVLTLTAVAMVILSGSRAHRETRKMATAQFNQQQLILVHSAAAGIESYFKELTASLSSLVKLPSIQRMTPECLREMQHTYWGFPPRTSMRLLDANGILRFIYPFEDWRGDLEGKDYGREAYFQEARETGRACVKRVINEQGEARIRVAVPVYPTSDTRSVKVGDETGMVITPMDPGKQESGVFQGVLIGSFDPQMIAQQFISPIVSGKSGYAWWLSEEGVFVAHYEEAFIGRNAFVVRKKRKPDISYEALERIQRRMMAGEEGIGRYVSGWHRGGVGAVEKLVAYTPVHMNGTTWSVAVCAPVREVEEMIEETKHSGQVILGLVILVLILGGGSLFGVSYRWSHILEQDVVERTKELRETGDYLNNLIRHANAPIIVWNPDKQVTMFNQAFEKMSGRTEAEMKERPLDVLFPEESRADSLKNIEETSKGEHWETVEIPILNKSGETRMALWNSANIYSEDGATLMATIAQGQDITERVRAEERIEQQNSVLRAIRSVNQLIVTEKDRDRLLQKVCDALIEARDYDAAWLGVLMDGKHFAAFKGSGFREHAARFRERLMNGDHPPCIENALDRKAPPLMVVDKSEACGDCFFKEACPAVEVAIIRVEHANRVLGLLAISLASDVGVDDEEQSLLIEVAGDIGIALHSMELEKARRQAEEALRQGRDFAESLIETAQTIVLVLDTEGRIVRFNRYMEALSGYGLDEVRGRDWFTTFLPERDRDRIRSSFLGVVGDMQTRGNVNPIVAKDGREIDIEWSEKTLKDAEGRVDGVLAIGQDITERKKMEKELIRLSDAMRMSSDGVVLSDLEAKITDVNEAIRKMLGTDKEADLIGKDSFDLIAPEDREKAVASMKEVMEKGYVKDQECRVVTKGGSKISVSMSISLMKSAGGEPIGFVGIVRDITEHKHLEEQLRRAQKMEAIGTLTGGVAHDFNNILTALQGNAELASMKVPEDDPIARNLIEIREGIQRAARLTHQLLLFSRQQPMEMTILNLNGAVDELAKMLKRLIGEHISLTTELAPGIWKVKGDFGTIEQVIMNLVINARDAMPKGGTISIRTRNAEVDEVFCGVCEEARPGRFVCLSVRDSGVGIDPAIMDRIFDPFFTTKGLGVGTGLGLSVVYGIVKQHEGWITMESAPEDGALFEVYLPAISIEPEEDPQNASVSLEAFRGSGERILVVEDEKVIRDLSAEVLSQSGYAVFAAANAQEALELFEKEGGNFALLFCDVVLPDGRGPELSEQLLKRNPGLRVLFTSGYMNGESDWQAIRERGYPFLQKPYPMSDFLRAVRDVLKNH